MVDDQSSFKDANQSFNSSFSKGSFLQKSNIIHEKGSVQSSQFSNYGKQVSTNLSGSSRNQNQFKNSFASSFSRNRKNRKSGQYQDVRVQVISDFDSQNETFDQIDSHELDKINKNIGELEEQELIRKRASNVYDILGV